MKIQVSEGLCLRVLKALEEKAIRDADESKKTPFPIDVCDTQAWRDNREMHYAMNRIRAEPRKDFGKYSGRRNKN
jgi:hypothetical protein